MIDEKKYLKKLLAELKHFFVLDEDNRAEAAMNLEENWAEDEILEDENSGLSKETIEIVSSLGILHHYEDNPEEHDYMLKQILIDVENRLKILEKEGKEDMVEEDSEEEKDLNEEGEELEAEEKFIV